MPIYPKDTELKRKLRQWFIENDQRHRIGDVVYAFGSYKYDQVRVAVKALEAEGYLSKEKYKGKNEYWMNKDSHLSNLYNRFFTIPVPRALAEPL